MALLIKPVETSREKSQFLELPWQIQGKDPNWIPPLRKNQKELVGFKRHPFYERARSQAFLAIANGQPVGRVLALVNPVHNEYHKENRGFFGFFECLDDVEAAQGLLAEARKWLTAQGMTAIRGPVNPSLNYECGLLIDGFETPPMFMMTHNPPY